MSRVLVIGATGFIGSELVRVLSDAVDSVVPSSRKSLTHALVRTDPAAVRALLKRERCDTLVDLVAYDAPSTARLCASVRGDIDRYVLVSSSDVYRSYGALHRREPHTPGFELIDESAPLRISRFPLSHRCAPARGCDRQVDG